MTVSKIEDARGVSRKLVISTGATRTAKKAKQSRLSWPMLVEKMREPVRTNERYAEYLKLPKSEQDAIKDVGWFVGGRLRDGVRKKDHLETRDLVTLDIDFAGGDWDFDLDESYGEYAFALYTTHKHNNDSPRLRLVFPLSRSVTADEYPAIARMVASLWDVEVFDDTTYQASRVMYWPSCSTDADYQFIENDGAFLDPDDVLAMYDDWTDVASWPVSIRQGRAIETGVEKAADPLLKRGPIGDFCRAFPVSVAIETFLSHVYAPSTTSEGRYTYTGGSTSNGVILYNDDRFLYSNHGTDPAGGRSVNAFDAVRIHQYGHLDENSEDVKGSKLASFKAMVDFVNRDDTVAEARIENLFDDWDEKSGTENDAETPAASDPKNFVGFEVGGLVEFTDDDREALKALDRNEDGSPKNHISNAILILRHDKRLKGAVAWNEFAQDFVQVRDLPGFKVIDRVNGDLWQDVQDSFLTAYIHKRYDIEIPSSRMINTLNNIGGENSFHPVRDYLRGLVWDGKPRLDTLLIDHFKAEDSAYTRAVTRKTFTAAAARIFEPGIKFDNMLILEGVQGVGKSSFFRDMAQNWFTDSVGNFGKDSVENLKGKWLAEVGELSIFKKAEVEHIKAFLSRQVDRIREAYARRSTDFPRQSICIGSTNETGDYLKDDENRRFWPVRCHVSEFVQTMSPETIAQFWAEAMTAYKAGEPLFLDDAAIVDEAKAQQAERQSDRDVLVELAAWLDRPTDDDFEDEDDAVLRETVTVQEIWSGFYDGRGKPNNADRAQIRKLMKLSKGWSDDASSRKIDGVSVRAYTRSRLS